MEGIKVFARLDFIGALQEYRFGLLWDFWPIEQVPLVRIKFAFLVRRPRRSLDRILNLQAPKRLHFRTGTTSLLLEEFIHKFCE
jgi:hypothetical protein